MPTESDKNVISLKEYIDTRFHAFEENMAVHLASLEKAVAAALNSQATALVKAEQATEYRLAGMNEFRKAVEDQSNKQATKSEVDALRSILEAKIERVAAEHGAELKAIQKTINLVTGGLLVLQIIIGIGLSLMKFFV